MSSSLESTMKITKTIISAFGSFPTENGEYKLRNLIFIIIYLQYCIFITISTMSAEWPDLPKVAMNAGPMFAAVGALFKSVNYTINRNLIFQLMKSIRTEFWDFEKTISEEEQHIITYYAKKVYKFNVLQAAILYAAGALNLVKPIMLMYILSPIDENVESVGRVLPYNHWMPFIDMYVDPMYQIFFIAQGFGIFCSISVLAAMDTLLVFLIFNVCGQYKVLQNKIINFNTLYKKSNCNTPEKFLQNCIAYHQKLNKYCEDLETCVTIALFGEFLAVCPFLCISAFTITAFPGYYYVIFENVFSFTAGLLQLFLYCYPADQLTEQALKIADSAYTCDWINTTPKCKKLLLIIILCSQKPFYLTALKFLPVTVSSFELVTRTAMSYFTVLTTMNEDE